MLLAVQLTGCRYMYEEAESVIRPGADPKNIFEGAGPNTKPAFEELLGALSLESSDDLNSTSSKQWPN